MLIGQNLLAKWRRQERFTGESGIINQFQRSSPVTPVLINSNGAWYSDGAYQNVKFFFSY